MTHHTRGADGTRRSARQALQHFKDTGQTECAEMLANLLDGRRHDARAERRRELFPPDVADFLAAQDRRRDTARRLPPICPFSDHEHALGCHDPIAAGG
jgi:hypothetical protein